MSRRKDRNVTEPHTEAGATHDVDVPEDARTSERVTTPEETSGALGPAPATEPASGAAPDTAPEETAEVLRERWLRTEADLQNFRRRARRDLDEAWRSSEEAAVMELVSFLDDLERAVAVSDTAGAPPTWSEGVRLVVQRMKDHLTRQRVEVIDPVGAPFDPTFHEAVLEVDAPDDVPAGHVVTVVHKGYRRDGRALRAARVVVAREPGSGAG